jgi:hypothetical protein
MVKKKAARKKTSQKKTKKPSSRARLAGKAKKRGISNLDLAKLKTSRIQSEHPTGHAGGHAVVISGVRTTECGGHNIQIKTSYEIAVDGVPFAGHVELDNSGRLHTHACPYHEFASATEMMRHIVEAYPESFGDHAAAKEAMA